MRAHHTKEAIEQNLRDAGCDEKCICRFMEDMEEKREKEGLKLLQNHRRKLLDALHREQKHIDCLDYLVYTIEKNEKKGEQPT